MSAQVLWVMAIAMVVAAACSLAGVFLVLRRMALVSDAISHTILLGIVGAFLLTRDLNHPLLIIAAAGVGVLTVWLIELAVRTRLVKADAAIGLVFPALFAIAVILVNMAAGDVHIDTHMVLLGEIAFAPLDVLTFAGLALPKALWAMGAILIANAVFIALFYKELKLSTLDTGLAAALGFMPGVLHYALVALVSITAVGAFDAVGSILVVALMITPAATAYLLTDRLPVMIGLSVAIGAGGSALGVLAGRWLNAPYAGTMACTLGVIFLLALLLSPSQGLIALMQRRRRQRWEFARGVLLVHLLQHEGDPEEEHESELGHITHLLRWTPQFAARVTHSAGLRGLLAEEGQRLLLTQRGREAAQEVLLR